MMTVTQPALVTVVVPSLNQGRFLASALDSILEQRLPLEIILMDGGSNDETRDVIDQYEHHLFYWQSEPDGGQAAAINVGMERGSAPWVCWLNSDDFFYPHGLKRLQSALQEHPAAPFAFGHAWHVSETGRKRVPYLTLPYRRTLMANYCGICQPATLIRRSCWEAIGGLDDSLHLAFDYDLWLHLAEKFGTPVAVNGFVAANRMHNASKTSAYLDRHYDESIEVVRRHFGSVPIKWRVLRPIMRKIRNLARFLRA
jgi:glycosyltransferase involved in cell wall biosynthesis